MSPDLENDSEIVVLPDMGSDHRPTLITIRQNGIFPRQQRSRWNFKKANWEGFRAISEREFRNSSWKDDIDGLEETFSSTILKSSNLHIPKGSHQKYKPLWNEEIEAAVSSRRQARIELEACPTIASKKNYNKATAVVKRVIVTAKKNDFLPPTPDITNILYSTTDQLKNTSKFYHMAMGRRANAHKLLD
ncbi:RNA-directed DNA polymerase from mobile element jockey [Elysia marginata]|uniref:RNA-directed DNA polymerase from mobile element jockey n=1 Tax=Elysia marginata TaxID=1093978 RepID=A0AAV4I2V8_9GAST|nr:RNA-directed DNA polymerase from mobile element jockey [Elysia marginata]